MPVLDPQQSRRESLTGSYPAMVSNVRGVDLQTPYALVEVVSYDLVVDVPGGQLTFANQLPRNRRWQVGTEIMYARPGDECVANFRGPVVRFIIPEVARIEDCP